MATVRDHYDGVLAEHYSRMFGDFEAKVTEQRALLERLGVSARPSGGLAVDLGCGSGFQSVALARLGFRVLAVDFSQRLLAELRDRARGLPVEAIAGDIRDVARLVPAGIELVVCMGDTLAHLEREADLDRVFHGVAGRLMAGGRLVLAFRDLSGELREVDMTIADGGQGARSQRRDDRGARAADLRKISAPGALPVEDDLLATREGTVRIRSVGPPGQRAAAGAAAAAWTAGARRGRAPRGDELICLDDVFTDALEIGDREAAAGPVRAGHHAALGRDSDSRPSAAWAGEVVQPEYAGEHRLGGGDEARGSRQATEGLPELLVGEREAVGPRGLVDVDSKVGAEAGGHVSQRRQASVVDRQHRRGHLDRCLH